MLFEFNFARNFFSYTRWATFCLNRIGALAFKRNEAFEFTVKTTKDGETTLKVKCSPVTAKIVGLVAEVGRMNGTLVVRKK